MKVYQVILEEAAQAELEAAYQWIARDNPDAAISWYNDILDAIEALRSFPDRSPIAPEAAEFSQNLRHLIHGSYRAIYTVRLGAVHVLHVVHGARERLKPEEGS